MGSRCWRIIRLGVTNLPISGAGQGGGVNEPLLELSSVEGVSNTAIFDYTVIIALTNPTLILLFTIIVIFTFRIAILIIPFPTTYMGRDVRAVVPSAKAY